MFNIIFKKRTLTIDCFTDNPAIFKFFPIVEAKKCYPQWWKNLESHFQDKNSNSGVSHNVPTLKRCDGILGLYSKGFCIPLWSDLIIETNSHGEYRYQYSSDENAPIVSHGKNQLGSAFDKFIHVKILSPWLIQEKTGVNFYFSGANWNLINYMFNINILPGVVNFKDQMSTHINLFLPSADNRLEFSSGDILTHIIPLSEFNIQLKHHLISSSEFQKKMLSYSFLSSFMGRYKKNARQL